MESFRVRLYSGDSSDKASSVMSLLGKLVLNKDTEEKVFLKSFEKGILNEQELIVEGIAEIVWNKKSIRCEIKSVETLVGKTVILLTSTDSFATLYDFIHLCSKKPLSEEIKKPDTLQIMNWVRFEDKWVLQERCGRRTFDTLFLPEGMQNQIEQKLDHFLHPQTQAEYSRRGLTYRQVVLLEGLVGSGKSSLVKVIASKYGLPICPFHCDESDAKNSFIRVSSDSILLMEDIDRASQSPVFVHHLGNLLNMLDGCEAAGPKLVFLTANDSSVLDEALLRRCTYRIMFTWATPFQIQKMVKSFFPSQTTEQVKVLVDECSSIKTTMSIAQNVLFRYWNKNTHLEGKEKSSDWAQVIKEIQAETDLVFVPVRKTLTNPLFWKKFIPRGQGAVLFLWGTVLVVLLVVINCLTGS
jgi:hypothetical protein